MVQIVSEPLVVVSDIHLKHSQDSRAELLLDLISRVDTEKVEYFVLLGDIFDFCLGSHTFFQKKFALIGQSLTKLARSGVKVLFFEGNHEFALAKIGWPDVQFITVKNHRISLKNGAKIALCHGDLLAPSLSYNLFRSFVKSRPILSLSSSLIPGKWLDNYALTHAHVSRMHHEDAERCHRQVKQGVDQWQSEQVADFYIFGHYHIPYAESLVNGHMACLDSWYKPNYLVVDEELQLKRCYMKAVQEPYVLEAAKSFFV